MLIIPAIDLRGGKCVRLSQGDFNRETVYSDDPVETARAFMAQGAEWIHVVDLDGARSGTPQNLPVLKHIMEQGLTAKIEFGGGMRTLDAVRDALDAGAARVVVGSALATSDDFAAECFQLGEQVVAGIDTRDGMVAVHGWGTETGLSGTGFARRMVELGCRRVIWTDIATDGMLAGPNLEGLMDFVSTLPVPIIASGGVSNIEDLLAIAKTGAEAAIAGKAIYEGRFTVEQAIRALA